MSFVIVMILSHSGFAKYGFSKTVTINVGPEYTLNFSETDTLYFSGGFEFTFWLNDTVPAPINTKGYGLGVDRTANNFRFYLEEKRILFWKQYNNPFFFITSGYQYGPSIDYNNTTFKKSGIGVQSSVWIFFGPFIGMKVNIRLYSNKKMHFGIQLTNGYGGHVRLCE